MTWAMIWAHGARAQEAPPPAVDEQKPAAKGLLDGLGKILTAPADLLPSLKPADTPKPPPAELPAVAVPAAPAPVDDRSEGRLLPSVVTGREVCPATPGGGPDCKAGADKMCQAKGFKEGKSLSTDSAYNCSVRSIRASIEKKEGAKCVTENFVTRAFCQ